MPPRSFNGSRPADVAARCDREAALAGRQRVTVHHRHNRECDHDGRTTVSGLVLDGLPSIVQSRHGGLVVVTFRPSGDAAILAVFGDEIDRTLSGRVFGLYKRAVAHSIPGVVACIPAFTTLLVQFDPTQTDGEEVARELADLWTGLDESRVEAAARWRIPVCYAPELAPDLEEVCRSLRLSAAELATRHSARPYVVYMLGGFPGYPYLGDVPEPLRVPRRTSPRLRVEPGTVALAGQLSSIYPMPTPGGWNLIGRTPVAIFDLEAEQPALLSPGDEVSFFPVSLAEYDDIAAAAAAGQIAHSDLLAGPA
jgi:KipI family sensor histidine kinase inhibitor